MRNLVPSNGANDEGAHDYGHTWPPACWVCKDPAACNCETHNAL